MIKLSLKLIVALSLVLSWFVLGGCGESRTPFVGTYRSDKPYAGKGHIELVLQENGEGTWTLGEGGTSIKFKWRAKEGRIWIYTKEGGILIVTVTEGGTKLSADMSGEWHPGCPIEQCIAFSRVKAE